MRIALISLALLTFPLSQAAAQPWPLAVKRIAGRIIPPIADGTLAREAFFGKPAGIAIDAQRQTVVADAGHRRVYRIDGSGKVYTLATIETPGRIAVDRTGNVYVIDALVSVWKITPDGRKSRFAGNGAQATSLDGKPALETSFLWLNDLAVDPEGRLCLMDEYDFRVRRVEADGTVKTIAGNGKMGYSGDGGPAVAATMGLPTGLAFLPSGEMLISELLNGCIRKVSKDGTISTLAGTKAQDSNLKKSLYYPSGVAVAANGDIYFLELNTQVGVISGGQRLAPISVRLGVSALAPMVGGGMLVANSDKHDLYSYPAPTITGVLAGGMVHYAGEGSPALTAIIDQPRGLAVDGAGNYYVSDYGNRRIRRVKTNGNIETYAGTGQGGFNGNVSSAKQANFDMLWGIAIDPKGVLYVADSVSSRIRAIEAEGGAVTTFAGNGEARVFDNWATGAALKTPITQPQGLTRTSDGGVYIGTSGAVKRVTTAGNVEILSTGGWTANSNATLQGFTNVYSIAVDSQAKNLLVIDSDRIFLVKVGVSGTTNLGAGDAVAVDAKDNFYLGFGEKPYIGVRDAKGVTSVFAGGGAMQPSDISLAADTNLSHTTAMTVLPDNHLAFVIGDSVFRTFSLTPAALRTVSGDRQKGWIGADVLEPLQVKVTGTGDLPVANAKVTFSIVQGVATLLASTATTDKAGMAAATLRFGNMPGTVTVRALVEGLTPVTFQLTSESLLYQVPPSGTTQAPPSYVISTAAGATPSGDNVDAKTVWLDSPAPVAIDAAGNLVVADRGARRIRQVSPGGVISTVGGQASWRSLASIAVDAARTVYVLDGDEIRGIAAGGTTRTLPGKYPGATSIGADNLNRVYVAEPDAGRVRVIFPNNQILVFAGTGAPEQAAGMTRPTLVTVAGDYTVYVADPGAQTVWKVSPQDVKEPFLQADLPFAISDLTALAADPSGALFLADRAGNIFRASADVAVAYMTTAPDPVSGMAIDAQSNLYVTSAVSGQIRKLDATGTWTLAAGITHFFGDGGPAVEAALNRPRSVAAAPGGGYYIADTDNGRVRLVDTTGVISTIAGGGQTEPPLDGSPVKAREARLTPISVLPTADGTLYINNGTSILVVTGEGDLRTLLAADTFRAAGSMALDSTGRIVFADAQSHRVVGVAADGTVELIAGNGTTTAGVDGTSARQTGAPSPRGVAVDARGLVYIAFADRVRRIEADGTWFTLPGAGTDFRALTFDERGAMFILESNAVRLLAPPTASAIVAGKTDAGFAGDGGPAAQALLNTPYSVALGATGELLVADTQNCRIRRLTPAGP